MREKFKQARIAGTINVRLDNERVWKASKNNLMRAIIDVCESYQSQGYSLTLRQLYYQLVAKDMIPNHDKVYSKLSKLKDDCVYSGYVDWDVFEDRGRVPKIAYFEESVKGALERTKDFFKLDRQIGQPKHIEVWTEKDAISAILKRVTDPYTIRLVVNKGYSSSTAMYGAYSRFAEAIEAEKKVVILYFGDHDPSGLDMVRDINERILFFLCFGTQIPDSIEDRIELWWRKKGLDVYDVRDFEPDIFSESDLTHLMGDGGSDKQDLAYDKFQAGKFMMFIKEHELFEVKHIGLTMDQIREYRPPHNPAKITDPRAKDYINQFGQRSWEVDALSPSVMTRIVRSAIESEMDLNEYDKIKYLEKDNLKELTKLINKASN